MQDAFAFVWQYPKGADLKKAPVSLSSLLNLNDKERAHHNQVRPSVTEGQASAAFSQCSAHIPRR